jgi:hypothetical protein
LNSWLKDIEDCSQEEKSVFPDRMKIWLDEVLHILVILKNYLRVKIISLNNKINLNFKKERKKRLGSKIFYIGWIGWANETK